MLAHSIISIESSDQPDSISRLDMHIPARVDYAMRALLELAERDEPTTADALARAQKLPTAFLAAILSDLRRSGLVTSRRGIVRGYRLARPAGEITVGDVMRAIDASIDGFLAEVHKLRQDVGAYEGPARHLEDVWVAARASLRAVVESVTLEHIVRGRLPAAVAALLAEPAMPAASANGSAPAGPGAA